MLTLFLAMLFIAACIWLLAIRLPDALGSVRRSTPAARRWRAPHGWLREAFCIHRHESVDWYRAGVDWAGNPSPYYGGFQFLVSTWQSVGGRGLPSDWPPREQVYRAFLVWQRDGGSWAEWGTAGVCGLR